MRMLQRSLVLASLLLTGIAVGCSSSDSGGEEPGGGAGGSGGSDAGTEAGPDGAGGADGDTDAGPDGAGGTDGETDGGTDGPTEAGPTADLSCVGSVTYPAPAGATATVTLSLSDFITTTAFSGISVKACAKADTACASPLDTQTSDGSGKVVLTVPTDPGSFDGFFDISGGSLYPTLAYFATPIGADLTTGLRMITSTEANLLAGALAPIDAAKGTILAQISDCANTAIAGATASVDTADGDTTKFYFNGALPDKNRTTTDASGFAGFLNLPPGAATTTATVGSTTVSTFAAQVRAGTLSIVILEPTP